MEKFKREMMSIELHVTCVSEKYFFDNLREYYNFLTYRIFKSKDNGFFGQHFYRIKSSTDIQALGLDKDFYRKLPCFICVSNKYEIE